MVADPRVVADPSQRVVADPPHRVMAEPGGVVADPPPHRVMAEPGEVVADPPRVVADPQGVVVNLLTGSARVLKRYAYVVYTNAIHHTL